MSSLDKIFEITSRRLPAAGVNCLLIGGFAVNHYGYTRNTLDVDFMIVTGHMNDVRQIMTEEGFTNVEIKDNVAFFSTPGKGLRVDFLQVDEPTMNRLLNKAVITTIRGHELKVPSLKHLIAMKIFAFAQNTARRMGKDLPDIAYLSVINNLDPEKDIKPLCDQFGSSEVYQLIREQIEGLRAP